MPKAEVDVSDYRVYDLSNALPVRSFYRRWQGLVVKGGFSVSMVAAILRILNLATYPVVSCVFPVVAVGLARWRRPLTGAMLLGGAVGALAWYFHPGHLSTLMGSQERLGRRIIRELDGVSALSGWHEEDRHRVPRSPDVSPSRCLPNGNVVVTSGRRKARVERTALMDMAMALAFKAKAKYMLRTRDALSDSTVRKFMFQEWTEMRKLRPDLRERDFCTAIEIALPVAYMKTADELLAIEATYSRSFFHRSMESAGGHRGIGWFGGLFMSTNPGGH